MKKIIFINFILLSQYLLFSENYSVEDMYIEVKYNSYHYVFLLKDEKCYYQDSYYNLHYYPETEHGVVILWYWQQDFKKLLRRPVELNENGNNLFYRDGEEKGWTEESAETTKGKILLSMMSKIQRFTLEEQRWLMEHEEEAEASEM